MSDRIYAEDEFVELKPEEIEKLKRSIEVAKNGRRWTLEEATNVARENRD